MKQRRRFLIGLHVVLVIGMLAQTFQFIFAQDHGYLPPADPADQLVETWQDDGSGDWLEDAESGIAWSLPEQAETLFDLVPEHLPVVQAEPASKDEMGQVAEIVTITPDGAAAFFLHEQLLLLFNQGTFTQDTQIALTPLEANTELSATSGPLDQLRFHLSATDTKTGEAILDLPQSYYLALDLTALATPDARWFAAFQDHENTRTWIYPEPQRHNEAGLISVPYRAMGLVSAGNEALITLDEASESENLPKPWRYQWQVPAVSTFSGAATYQYPIEVPPGRGGLMPNIDISYSSSGANGHIFTDGLDQGPLGLGWNINQIEITRDKTELRYDGAHYAMFHADQFSLVIDGQSYRLVRYAGDGTSYADYYAINGPSLRVRQIYDANAPANEINSDRLYWVVKSGNGTTYRLGYTNDAESGQSQNPGFPISEGNQLVGTLTGYGGLRWRVDTVTDIHGNQVQYDYEKWTEPDETYQGASGGTAVTTTRSRLKEIRYNYVTVATNANTRLTTNYGTKIVFTLTSGPRRVEDIRFYHLNLNVAEPYRIVDIDLSVRMHSNGECGQGARSNHIEVVDAIREKNADNSFLPTVTFHYADLPHDPIRDNNPPEEALCFVVSHLDRVTNGYGGQVDFTYAGDGRHNGYTIYNPPGEDPPIIWVHPTYGQSFFVTKTETRDGIHLDPAVTTYNLEFPCYDQDGGDLGTLPGATNCQTRPGININGHWYEYGHGALVGFAKATVTSHDYNIATNTLGPILNRTITQFQQAQATMGWVMWQELYDASLTLIQKQENSYSLDTDNESTFVFNYLAQQTTTQHLQGQSASHTVRYEYGRQNNIQYGNQTKVIEEGTIGGITNKQRLVYRQYYPNTTPGTPWITTPWIVGAVAREAVFEGTAGVTINTGTATPVADSRNFYDSQTNWQTAPTRARLTRVDRLKTTTPLTYITVQQMVYDTTFTSNVEQVTDGNNHTTTTNYDGTYNLYPVSVMNHLGHTQQFRYYYLNATYNDGPPGLLRELIDANGFPTYYFFDEFERLRRLFRGWNEQGGLSYKPSEYYVYSDLNQTSVNPLRISTWTKTQDNATEGSTGGTFERQFFDGLGRVIQTQRPHTDWTGNWEGPTGGQRVIADTGYNAAGQAIWQSQPYFKPAGDTYFSPDSSQARINTQYNAGGQAVRQIGLDGAITSTIYGLRSVYQQDGNSHIRASFFDPTGQLTRVDETIDAFRDTFANTNNWTKTGSGSFTITGGHGRITHSGLGFTTINRVISANKKSGTSFSFKVTNGNVHSQLFMSRGNWGQPDYRLWGLQVLDGQLRLQQWKGTNGIPEIPLMPVKNNTWYRVILRAGYDGAFYNIVVWEENNPAISAEVRIDHHLDWAEYTDWKFDARTYGGNTLDIDTYDELDFYRTWYEYDVLGNLKKVTDAADNVTTMTYNNLGQKVTMNDPDMGYWLYGYDNGGNLIAQTDAEGQTITFAYDALNRLTAKRLGFDFLAPFLATYSYDSTVSGNKGVGRRTGMVAYDPPGVVSNSASWTYDIMGRVIREDRTVAGNSYRFDFGYTQGDLPVTVRYPGGPAGQQGELVTTNYRWITGQPKTLVGDSTYVYDAQYNKPTGQITRLNLAGTTMYTDYSYNVAFRLSSIYSRSNNTDRLWYSYMYDLAGNVQTITDNTPPGGGVTAETQIQHFQYDALNRLIKGYTTAETTGQYNETYAYDEIGNLINKAGQEMAYGDGTAGPHAVTTIDGNIVYEYDENGNMVLRPDGNSGTHTLYWTPENMLKQVINDKGVTKATFTYDADGMMVLRTDVGGSTVYLGKVYQHKLAANVVTKHYMFNGQLVAQRTVDGQGGSSVTFLLGDHLGSVTTVLWASGAVKDNQRYNPWGEVRWAQSGNPITGYSYTSQRYDDALGLYDYNARYYDPTIGRFISADTIVPEPEVPQGLNRFTYTLNNPLHFIDPSGHAYEDAPDDPSAPPSVPDQTLSSNSSKGSDGPKTGWPLGATIDDPVAQKAYDLVGMFHWQNPPNDFTSEFFLKDLGILVHKTAGVWTMNCWESILYCALLAGEVDEQWIIDFEKVTNGSNWMTWSKLGAFGAESYNQETAEVGQFVFFTLDGDPYPGHVAIYIGHGQVMSLWSLPDGNYSFQRTSVTELTNQMQTAFDDRPVSVTLADPPWWN